MRVPSACLLALCALATRTTYLEAASADYTISEYPKVTIRAPRSIGNFFKRIFTRNKTGFQGTSIANSGYATSASSYYPSYGGAPSYPSPYGAFASSYGGYPGGGGGPGGVPQSQVSAPNPYGAFPGSYPAASYANYPTFSSYPGMSQMSQMSQLQGGSQQHPGASSPYPTYSHQGGGGQNPGSPDFHAVLDQFVRNSGLSPMGAHDQEAAASSIQAKGDTPVFSFKKLYSFPFFLSSDNNQHSSDGFNVQIPYMKRHIRRMSSPAAEYERQKLQVAQSALQQQQVLRALASSDYLSNYIQQYLRDSRSDQSPAESQASIYHRKPVERLERPSSGIYRDAGRGGGGSGGGGGQVGGEDVPSRSPLRGGSHYDSGVSDNDQQDSSMAESQYQPKFADYYRPPHHHHQSPPPGISSRTDADGDYEEHQRPIEGLVGAPGALGPPGPRAAHGFVRGPSAAPGVQAVQVGASFSMGGQGGSSTTGLGAGATQQIGGPLGGPGSGASA